MVVTDRVKSRLRQWDPWRALNGIKTHEWGQEEAACTPLCYLHGELCHSVLLKALQSCLGLWVALLGFIATPTAKYFNRLSFFFSSSNSVQLDFLRTPACSCFPHIWPYPIRFQCNLCSGFPPTTSTHPTPLPPAHPLQYTASPTVIWSKFYEDYYRTLFLVYCEFKVVSQVINE